MIFLRKENQTKIYIPKQSQQKDSTWLSLHSTLMRQGKINNIIQEKPLICIMLEY